MYNPNYFTVLGRFIMAWPITMFSSPSRTHLLAEYALYLAISVAHPLSSPFAYTPVFDL